LCSLSNTRSGVGSYTFQLSNEASSAIHQPILYFVPHQSYVCPLALCHPRETLSSRLCDNGRFPTHRIEYRLGLLRDERHGVHMSCTPTNIVIFIWNEEPAITSDRSIVIHRRRCACGPSGLSGGLSMSGDKIRGVLRLARIEFCWGGRASVLSCPGGSMVETTVMVVWDRRRGDSWPGVGRKKYIP
jgi:hypothetical protein